MAETIFLTKAKRNLQAAQLLFDHQMYDESANRAYYAAFQAALAALSNLGMPVEGMSHEAAQAAFNTELIRKRKVYPGNFRSYLYELQTIRLDADYKLVFVSKKVASKQIKKAQEFVDRIVLEMNK